MNVNSGGPHILLFERDQQLTTLLTSEFQLAGYECHPARTAVEVFDAIARYPIRLVLVNLAQAAASRREFWVALDAQRRGRGVQVLTFRCMNIAGYGSDDSEESSRTVLTDMEVEGMIGVMNLVAAVRARIPGSTTGSYSRIAAMPDANAQEPGNQNPASSGAINPTGISRAGNLTPGFTDKIRAVIYPSSRSYPPMPETNRGVHNPQNPVSTQRVASTQDTSVRPQGTQSSGESNSPLGPQRQSAQNMQAAPVSISAVSPLQEQESGLAQLSRMVQESRYPEKDVDSNAISTLPLRASPIQDIPIEREQEYRSGHSGTQSPPSEDTAPGVAGAPLASFSVPITIPPSNIAISPSMTHVQDVAEGEEDITTGAREENIIARILAEMPQLTETQTPNQPSLANTTSDDTLLNIVQSLPPMSALPTPPSQPKTPVLSGRATRSLGSVLLEGHLVPQHRLEVAQHIQRMLRGVDMNYQLGEILLMFKLLTPDQLLAASLVSYGLISTTQISTLGRIRQELHAIGLEYDLESLLVLFRILRPEQLREVRASWSG
jgi:hypothetical protein